MITQKIYQRKMIDVNEVIIKLIEGIGDARVSGSVRILLFYRVMNTFILRNPLKKHYGQIDKTQDCDDDGDIRAWPQTFVCLRPAASLGRALNDERTENDGVEHQRNDEKPRFFKPGPCLEGLMEGCRESFPAEEVCDIFMSHAVDIEAAHQEKHRISDEQQNNPEPCRIGKVLWAPLFHVAGHQTAVNGAVANIDQETEV